MTIPSRCSECNDVKSAKRCTTCKSNDYYRSKGIVIDSACKTCSVITRLYANAECNACLKKKGLKECRVCSEIKPAHISFDKKKGVCRDCLHPMAHLPRWLRTKNFTLKQKYGIDGIQYLALAEQQKHLCLICHRKLKLMVDYDEKTKKVRGLLCQACLNGVNSFKASTESLSRAVNYLSSRGNLSDRGDTDGREMEMLQVRLRKVEGAISRSEE